MNKRLPLIIIALCVIMSSYMYGQSDLCDASSMMLSAGVNAGDNNGDGQDIDYNATGSICGPTDFEAQTWYQFTPSSNSAELTFTSTGISDASLILTKNCGSCGSDGDIVFYACGIPNAGMEVAGLCLDLGDTYWIGIASAFGNEGTFNIEIDEGTNLDGTNSTCANALALNPGTSTISNFCTDQNYLFFSYTMQTGGNALDIDVNATTPPNPIVPACGGFSNEQAIIADCSDPEAAFPSGICAIECLEQGETVIIRILRGLPHDFDITATESTVASEPFDLCATAMDYGELTCGDIPAPFVGNENACDDIEDETCVGNDSDVCDAVNNPKSVWATFTVDPAVPSFDVSGNGYQLFEGTDCSNITSINCDGAGPTTILPPYADNYYALVTGTSANNFMVTMGGIPPMNDDCVTALGVSTTNPIFSNTCATADPNVGTCPTMNQEAATVWFTYTPSQNLASLNIDINEVTIVDPGFAIYDMCLGVLLGQSCNAMPITLECLTTDPILIQVGSSVANSGDFDLIITEGNPTNPNDLCADAAADPENTLMDCTPATIAGNNTDSCPEATSPGGCGLDMDPTVWELLTLPAGTVALDFSNISTGFNITVYGTCGGPAFTPTCFTADTSVPIPGGTTSVLVAVSSASVDEGVYTFDVLPVVPPTNDNCLFPDDPLAGTLNNNCATSDLVSGCTPVTVDESTVWYTYDVTTPITSITIDLTSTTISNQTLNVYDAAMGCTGLVLLEQDCVNGATVTIDCPPVGELLIMVGSAFTDTGEFTIAITEGPASALNDLCANAEADPENTLIACTASTIAGTNANSCPEDFTLTGCNIDTEDTVWEELTLPAGTVSLEITNITPNFSVTVWDACGGSALAPVCLTADAFVNLAAGTTTVFISVSSLNGFEGPYTFDVLPVVPPVNDLCAGAIGLNIGSNSPLTNECATADVLFNACGGGQEEATVWYSYAIANPIDEIIINLVGTGANITAPAFMVLDGNAGCNGVFLDEACAEGDLIIECPPLGEIFIMVGSTFANTGEFEITITEGNPSPPNDLCANATPETPLTACVPEMISGNNEFACPEDFSLTGCNIDADPTVWHEVTVPAGTTAIEIEVTSGPISVTIWETPCPAGGSGTAILPVCVTGMDVVNLLTPGAGTYFVSVSTADGNEGPYTFNLTALVPPANDECADAEMITAGATPGTNICSTLDIDPNCTSSVDIINTVWYEYVIPAGVKAVTISIAGTGGVPITGIHVAALDGCPPGASLYQSAPDSETCDGSDIILTCPEPGESVFILVGSTSANEGDFNITITEDNPVCTYGNDECANAEAFPVDPITGAGEECISGCNELACPDPEIDGVCGVTTSNVVWFTVTTSTFDPSIETFITAEISNEMDFNPVVGIFTGSCPPVSSLSSIGCNAGNNVTVSNSASAGDHPMPNTTYFIAVANSDDTQTGGTFDLCVEVVQGCANDECTDALTINDGVTQVTTTNGCTADITQQACGGIMGSYEASAWYNYTVPAGVTAVLIETSGSTGDLVFDYGVNIDCADPAPFGSPSMTVDCPFDGSELVPCVLEGDIITIFLASEVTGEDFDLTVTGLPPSDPLNPSPDNDLCTDPTDVPMTECEFIGVNVDNTNACPETFSVAGCATGMFDEDATVWFSVTLPANATGMEFDNISNGSYLSVFDDVCPIVAGTPSLGCMDQATLTQIVGLTGGSTYLIAFANAVEGMHSFEVLAITQPENDGPCPTDPDFTPADLTGGASYSGTTCCALGFNDLDGAGNPLDLENVVCTSTLTQDNVVWFIYQWIDDGSDGIQIDFNPTGISSSASLEVYTSTDMNAGCSPPIPAGGENIVGFTCDAINDDPIRIGCPDPDVFYYIKLSTSDDACGDYTISVSPAVSECALLADDCVDAPMLMTQTPDNCDQGEIVLMAPGCLDLACPEDVYIDCLQDLGPTVWFQITIDDTDANGLYSQVTAPGFDAVWAVYEGTSCDDLTLVGDLDEDNPGSVFPCSFADGDPNNVFTVPIGTDPATGDDFTYWISVTAIGPVSDPNFVLNYGATLGCIACSGNDAQDCNNGEFEAFIDGELSEGPFCAGAEVEICLEFNYNTTGTGNDWLHGIIPSFGPGWDLDEIDFPSIDLGNPNWVWADADGGCAPYLNGYSLPNACTYTNDDGYLQMCNTSCNPGCACELGSPLPDGSPLPSGWFWSSGGSSPTCGGACTPSDNWGVTPGGTNVDVDICMTLIVKSFDSFTECDENKDLKIFFQTTSDAISGCWVDSSPCIIDPSFESPAWEIDCMTSPPAVAEIIPICSGTMAMTQVTIEGNLDGTIDVEVDPDTSPDILGQTDFMFTGGFGTINDVLINCGTTVDTARYIAFATVDGFNCPGVPVEIKIPVYPKITIDPVPDPYIVCLPHTIENLPANVAGGAGGYTIEWYWNGEGSPVGTGQVLTSYVLSADGFLQIQVTDSEGCTEMYDLPVDIFEKLEPEIAIDATEVCKDVSFLGASASVLLGQVDDWFWYTEDEDGNPINIFTGGNSGSNINIDPSDTSIDPGKYTIFVEASNDVGCVGIDSVCLTIYPIPNGEIVQQPSANCDSQVELCVEFYDANGNDIYGNGPDENNNGIPDLFEDDQGEPDFTITWYANFIPGGSTTNELCFLTTTQSFYDVEIESANGCIGFIGIDEIVLPTSTPPTIEPDTICLGQTATLAVMPQDYFDYEWEDVDGNPIGGGSAGPMINVQPMVSSTYFLTVTDANNCTGEASVTVEVNPLPDPQFSGNLSICAGQETEITALGDPALFDFNWLDGGGSSISMDSFVVITTTGTYTLELTNEFGCQKDTMFMVNTASELSINISGSDICDDDGCTTLNGGAGFDNYEWIDMGTGNVIVSGPTEQTLEVCDPGSYILNASQGVCSGSDLIIINQVDSPIIDIVDSEACNTTTGGSLWYVNFESLVLSSGGGTWASLTDPSISLSPLDSVSFSGLPMGDYEFVYTTNTALVPCADISDTITIEVGPCDCPNPNVSNPVDLCNAEDNYNLNDLIGPNTDFGQWVFLNGPEVTVLDGDTMFLYNNVAPGDYEFAYELVPVPIGTCTELADTISISVAEPPVADIEMFACVCETASTSGCNNGSTMLNLDDYVNSGTGGWIDPAVPGLAWTPPMLDFSGLPAGVPVTITFQTSNAIAPCDNVEYNLVVDVTDCNCPNVSVGTVPDQCNDFAEVDLTMIEDTNIAPGTWQESATNPTTGNLTSGVVILTDQPAGFYVFTYVLDTPVAGCDSESVPVIINVSTPPSVIVMDYFPCNVAMGMDSTTIDLNTLVSDPTIGTWVDDATGLPVTDTYLDFDGEAIGAMFTYTFTTNTAVAPCTDPSYTVTIEVTDCACPPLSFANPPILCSEPDGSVDLDLLVLAPTPSGTWTLVSSPAGSTADLIGSLLNANGSVAGVYTVEYQPDGELPICAETLDVTVSVPSVAELLGNQIICNTNTNGEDTSFDLNDAVLPGGEGGVWTDELGNIVVNTDIDFFGLNSTDYEYTYTLTSDAPCDDWVGTFTITAGDCSCPVVFDLDTYCSTGGTIELFDIFNIVFPGTWVFADGTPVPNSIIDYTGFPDGVSTVFFEMDDPGATCLIQYPVNFNIVSPEDLGEPAEPLRICEGEDILVNLFDLLPNAGAGGTWIETSVDGSTPGAFDDAAGTFTTGNESAASYTFQYELQSAIPCGPVAETVQVIIEGLPAAEAGDTQTLTCDDNMAELGNDAITSQGINFTYQWSESGGATIPNDTESSILVSESGVYTLVVTDINTGCSVEDFVTVNADGDIPSVVANATEISCFGAGDGTIEVLVTGGLDPIQYSIDGGATYGSDNMFTNLGPGNFAVAVLDGNGCETGLNIEIIQPERIAVDLGSDITLNETLTDTILTFSSNFPTNQIANVVWTDADGMILCEGTYDECREWMVGISAATVYCVEITSTNGCIANDCIQIRAVIVEDCYVPNIFSPNNDGQNDAFFMQCDEYATSVNKFFVFDRWGEMVYGIEGVLPNDPEVGWDGTLNDKDVEQGVYAYYIEVEFNGDPDNIEIFAGDITVVR